LYERYCSAASSLIWIRAPSTTRGLLALGCGFTRKNFRNKIQWGLIPRKASQKCTKTAVWKISLGLRLRYSMPQYPMSPLKKSLPGRESPCCANCANIGISSGFFSMGYGSPAAALHMSTSFSRRNPLLRRVSKSSVFTLDFFHSRFGFGRGGDTGGDVPTADPAASSRPLFFPPAAFVVFYGDGFILQVHVVFTRICSGATVVALYGGALRSTLHSVAAVCTGGNF
jgi:hypothetical protein